MPMTNSSGKYVPNYGSCKTVEALEQEFYTWAYDTCMGKFCTDRGVVYQRGTTDNLYIAEQNVSPNKFYITTTDKGSYYWYYGTDTALRDEVKKQKHAMTSAKREMRFKSGLEDTIESITAEIKGTNTYDKDARTEMQAIETEIKNGTLSEQEKANKIAEVNQKYGTNIALDASANDIKKVRTQTEGGLVNEVVNIWEGTKSIMEGTYVQGDESRKALQAIIDGKNNGTMDDKTANDEIWKWNKTYGESQGITISSTATVEDLKKVANKKNGILSITGNDIVQGIKEVNKAVNDKLPELWNNSTNEYIQKFTSQGVSGDIMWGVITGKYNKDDEARKDLEKLQTLVNSGKGNTQEAIALRNKINNDYKLNLDENVSAQDITNVLNSNDAFNYKKKVSKIAEDIVKQKLNENLSNMLEQKLGGKLRELGINFSFKDRDLVKDIHDIIRGQKFVEFNEQEFLDGLKTQLEKKIDKLITQKVNAKIDSAANMINSKIDSVANNITKQLDVYRNKLDNLSEKLDMLSSEKGKLAIADKLDKLVSSPVNAIANVLNAPDKLLSKLGIGGLGLGDMFKSITQVYTKGFAEKIHKVFAPAITKALAITKQVSEYVKKAIDYINNLREKAKQMVEKWKNAIKDAVKEQTQKLVNEIVKYVKLNITSALSGGFSI